MSEDNSTDTNSKSDNESINRIDSVINQKDSIEWLIKMVSYTGALFYGIGFFITALYNSNYNYNPIEILSPIYFLTGLIFLLLMGLIIYPFGFLVKKLEMTKGKFTLRYNLEIIFFVAIAVFVSYSFLSLMCDKIKIIVEWKTLLLFVLMEYVSLGIYYFIFKNTPPIKFDIRTLKLISFNPYSITYLILTFLTCIYIYNSCIFSKTAVSLGGGKPNKIGLQIKKSDISASILKYGMHKNDTSSIIELIPLRLIKESSYDYYVLDTNTKSNILILPKRIVQSAIILND